ncbi:MAG: ABC transporter substrate-binding protein, partial [Dehalococcoidia bacterium]|nr:ABC transporter substrate-binding protein [Dehalococcoidia bacterium]
MESKGKIAQWLKVSWLAMAVVIVLAFTACAPAAPAPVATPKAGATAAPKKLGKLRIGETLPNYAFQFINNLDIKKGFLEEEGIEPEISRASSNELLKSLVAGQLDMATMTPSLAFAAVEQGADIVLVGNIFAARDAFYVKKDINSIKDLVGKTIATGPIGSQPDQFINGLLA